MLNQGYGYQAWGGKRGRAPSPEQMGQALSAQQQQPMTGGLPSLGMPPMAMGGDEATLAGPPRGGGWGSRPEEQLAGGESYDPSAEHSASSTQAALADAIRRAQDTGRKPQLQRPPAPNQRWQLASLGLPALEIDLLTQTGDAAGGVG